MIRKMVCLMFAVLLLGDGLTAAPKKPKSLGRVVKVAAFPVVHPMKTLKGFAYGVLNTVGTVVDGVEYVTSEIAAGVSKVDSAVDTLAGESNPAPKGQTSGVSNPNPATP